METIFIANWHTNVIKQRILIERFDYSIRIQPSHQCENEIYSARGGVVNYFTTYDEALAWIKKKHLYRISKVQQDLKRAMDKHKHPVKFYALSVSDFTP